MKGIWKVNLKWKVWGGFNLDLSIYYVDLLTQTSL